MSRFTDDGYIYGAMLLDMLAYLTGRTMKPTPLGDGYTIAFFDGYDGDHGYIVYHDGVKVTDGIDYLQVDMLPKGERPHIHAVARLMYAQADTIVSRYLASLEASRPAAEAQLAKETQH